MSAIKVLIMMVCWYGEFAIPSLVAARQLLARVCEEDREVNKGKDREREQVGGFQNPSIYTTGNHRERLRQPPPIVKTPAS